MTVKLQFGGGWQKGLDADWTTLTEQQQDVTKPLLFPDNYADCIFTEHIFEHLRFDGAVHFLEDSYRVLKPGGIFRLVCPTLDALMKAEVNQEYINSSLMPYFNNHNGLLNDFGLSLQDDPKPFLFASMFYGHGHQFIWTHKLIILLLKKIGFTEVYEAEVGKGKNVDYCIERRQRGVYTGDDLLMDRRGTIFDCESGVIEAVK